jgi:hypothetical protein
MYAEASLIKKYYLKTTYACLRIVVITTYKSNGIIVDNFGNHIIIG